MPALENTITIGDRNSPLFVFHNAMGGVSTDGIKSINGIFAVDIIGNELSIDTVTAVVQIGRPDLPSFPAVRQIYLSPGDEVYISPNDEIYYTELTPGGTPSGPTGQTGDISAIPYGTPLEWVCDGNIMARFYLKRPKQVGRYLWQLTAVSGIGLLDKQMHKGGVYTGQTFQTVVTDIIGGAFPFTIAPALASQAIYNWLPYDTRRKNLHRLLLALGASIRRDANGEARFVFLQSDTPTEVGTDRVSVTGGSVTFDDDAVTAVDVTEHGYFPLATVEAETLYDNTSGGAIADHTLVKFGGDAPVIVSTLAVTGSLTIDESGVNYALVSGVGTLTGKRYTHVTRVVRAEVANPDGAENVKSPNSDQYLISLANSRNVAQRLLAYYTSASKISAQIKFQGEKCGDVLSMTDPFSRSVTAFLQNASVNASSTLLGACKLIEGYTPSHQGNNVSGSQRLKGSGTWTSPITGTLTAVLVPGGKGGSAGSAGQAAPVPSVSSYSHTGIAGTVTQARYITARNAKGGKGGDPGTPGVSGKILIVTINVTQGQQIAYSCGVGGAGEVYGSGTGGVDGGVTTFGSYSSANGVPYPSGYPDPVSGELLGAPGAAGVAGGDGVGYLLDDNDEPYLNIPDPIIVGGVSYSPGASGAETSGTAGGSNSSHGTVSYRLPGGFGGGAAYKRSGSNGQSGSGTVTSSSVTAFAAAGGAGAAAKAPPKATGIGQGGTGGNGGGGGGAFGAGLQSGSNEFLQATCYAENEYFSQSGQTAASVSLTVLTPASGGNGSNGGQGGNGGIQLYWEGD